MWPFGLIKQSKVIDEYQVTESAYSTAAQRWSLDNQITKKPSITCSKLTIETLEQGVKYVPS